MNKTDRPGALGSHFDEDQVELPADLEWDAVNESVLPQPPLTVTGWKQVLMNWLPRLRVVPGTKW